MKRTLIPLTVLLALAAPAVGGDMIEVGQTFPEFSLTAHDGSIVSSGELTGSPYLVYFYPKADTPGCTKEACAFRDRWSDVQDAGLKVFGVSYDSPEGNAKFATKYRLQFLLLSDTGKSLAAAVGARGAVLPLPKRISYLVGADARVLKAYPKVSPATHAAEVLEDLEALVP